MNKNYFNKLLIIQLIMLIFSLNIVFSANYYFNIELDHNFVDSDEITCEVTYDDNDKTWVVDEDTDNSDLEYEKNFEEFIEIDCDENIDEITLRIYEIDTDDKVFQERYLNEDKVYYELDLVDKDEEWFSIKINHNFDSSETIDCELTIDGTDYDYEFDENSDNDDLLIEKNYHDDLTFDCDDELDEIEFIVYDDDEEEIFSKTYEEDDKFDFENSDLDDKYELKIVIDHDFDDDEISCDLIIDNIDEINFDLDEDSDLIIYEYFVDSFEFDCDEELDELDLYIYDENGDKIDSEEYNDEDNIEYEINKGDYELFIQITNKFTEDDEIECDLIIDGEKEEDFEFTDSSTLGDLRIESQFENEFEFICEESMEKFQVLIFNNIDFDDDQIDEIEYTETKEFKYILNGDNEQIEEEAIDTVVEIITPQNNSNNEIDVEETLDTYENQEVYNQNENTLNSNEEDAQEDLNSTKQEDLIEEISLENVSQSSNLSTIVISSILIVVFCFLIYTIIINKEIFFDSKPKKRKHTQKVDLDYLKKKK